MYKELNRVIIQYKYLGKFAFQSASSDRLSLWVPQKLDVILH